MAVKPRPCQRCKQMIPAERLEAVPSTRLCVQCSRDVGGDFKRTVVVRGGKTKPGSIKGTGSQEIDVLDRRKDIEPLE